LLKTSQLLIKICSGKGLLSVSNCPVITIFEQMYTIGQMCSIFIVIVTNVESWRFIILLLAQPFANLHEFTALRDGRVSFYVYSSRT